MEQANTTTYIASIRTICSLELFSGTLGLSPVEFYDFNTVNVRFSTAVEQAVECAPHAAGPGSIPGRGKFLE